MNYLPLMAWMAISLTSVAHADLGDNEAQMIVRYGPTLGPKTTDKPGYMAVAAYRLSFENKEGVQTEALFYENAVEEESIYHRPYAPLSDAEVAALLVLNQQGQSWTPIAPVQESSHWLKTQQSWKRTDGTLANVEGPKGQPRMLFHIKSNKLLDAERKAR